MSTKKKALIIGIVLCLVAGAASVAVMVYNRSQTPDDSIQRKLIDQYLDAYREPNLAAVLKSVTGDMLGRLPMDGKEFRKGVEANDKTDGRIKSWKVLSSETNTYVGQSWIKVNVTTTRKTYNVVFDIFSDTGSWKIRAIKETEENQQNTAPNMGGMGQQTQGSHGLQ